MDTVAKPAKIAQKLSNIHNQYKPFTLRVEPIMTKQNDAVVKSTNRAGRGAGVKRSRWTEKEWGDIFAAIHSMFPELNLQDCRNVETSVIQPSHVKSAMMACIPITRHHATFKPSGYLDQMLVARANFEFPVKHVEAPIIAKSEPTARPTLTVRQQAEALFVTPESLVAPKPQELNQYEALFKSMLGMVSASIAAQIVPQLHDNIKHAVSTAYAAGAAASNQKIMDAINELRAERTTPVVAVAPVFDSTALVESLGRMVDSKLNDMLELITAPSVKEDAAAHAWQSTPTAPRDDESKTIAVNVKKRKIGLLGPMPDQIQNIRHTFPNVEFVCEEGSSKNAKNAFGTCECVITMKKLSNHSVGDLIKAQFGRNFHLVLGGVSSVKRQIESVLDGTAVRNQ
jgi:hypothetical protein